jgi:surface-anchored protein
MTRRSIPTLAALLAAVAISSLAAPASAANITFDSPVPGLEGLADLTFFYNSVGNAWVTTFRSKGTTVGGPTTTNATGLTAPFTLDPTASTPAPWDGIVGVQSPTGANQVGDYLFSSLTTNVLTTKQVPVGATNYFVSTALGSPFNPTTKTADLGIRLQLREDLPGGSGAVNQFDSFRLTLNPAASTFNGSPLVGSGAFVSLLNWSGVDPVAVIDSATSLLNWQIGVRTSGAQIGQLTTHVHRNWGFSQYGTYELAFNLQGLDAAGDPVGSMGTTTIGFVAAVPEPGTVSLAALGLLGAAGGFRWLRRRGRPAVSEAPAESLDA